MKSPYQMQYFTAPFQKQTSKNKFSTSLKNPHGLYVIKHEENRIAIQPTTDSCLNEKSVRVGWGFKELFNVKNTELKIIKSTNEIIAADIIVFRGELTPKTDGIFEGLGYFVVGFKYDNFEIVEINNDRDFFDSDFGKIYAFTQNTRLVMENHVDFNYLFTDRLEEFKKLFQATLFHKNVFRRLSLPGHYVYGILEIDGMHTDKLLQMFCNINRINYVEYVHTQCNESSARFISQIKQLTPCLALVKGNTQINEDFWALIQKYKKEQHSLDNTYGSIIVLLVKSKDKLDAAKQKGHVDYIYKVKNLNTEETKHVLNRIMSKIPNNILDDQYEDLCKAFTGKTIDQIEHFFVKIIQRKIYELEARNNSIILKNAQNQNSKLTEKFKEKTNDQNNLKKTMYDNKYPQISPQSHILSADLPFNHIISINKEKISKQHNGPLTLVNSSDSSKSSGGSQARPLAENNGHYLAEKIYPANSTDSPANKQFESGTWVSNSATKTSQIRDTCIQVSQKHISETKKKHNLSKDEILESIHNDYSKTKEFYFKKYQNSNIINNTIHKLLSESCLIEKSNNDLNTQLKNLSLSPTKNMIISNDNQKNNHSTTKQKRTHEQSDKKIIESTVNQNTYYNSTDKTNNHDKVKKNIFDFISLTNTDFIKITKKYIQSAQNALIERSKFTFNDIGGYENIKQTIIESVIWPIKHREIFKKYNISPEKGIILYGPPGCSKTLFAKAISNEANMNFINIKGPEIENKYVGETEREIREIFQKAKNNQPSIIFIDEIDCITSKRKDDSHVHSSKVLSAFLTELDGLEEISGVLILGATNRIDIIDPAFLRPGRINKKIFIDLPDIKARESIFRLKLLKIDGSTNLNYLNLSQLTAGLSGAEITCICNDATMELCRKSIVDHKMHPLTQEMVEKQIYAFKEFKTCEKTRNI